MKKLLLTTWYCICDTCRGVHILPFLLWTAHCCGFGAYIGGHAPTSVHALLGAVILLETIHSVRKGGKVPLSAPGPGAT